MNIHSLPVRLGLATLALSTASVLAFAQVPADPAAAPGTALASAPAGAPAMRHHPNRGLTARQQKRLDRLVATCGLSDVQKGQVKELMILSRHERNHRRHDGERSAAMNRHEMRHEFRSILTPAQFAKLQAARAARLQARAAQAAAANAGPATP